MIPDSSANTAVDDTPWTAVDPLADEELACPVCDGSRLEAAPHSGLPLDLFRCANCSGTGVAPTPERAGESLPACPICGEPLSDATGDLPALGWAYDCEACETCFDTDVQRAAPTECGCTQPDCAKCWPSIERGVT